MRFAAVDTGNLNMLDAGMSRDTRERLLHMGHDSMEQLLQEIAA